MTSFLLLLPEDDGGAGGAPVSDRSMQARGRARARLWWLVIGTASLLTSGCVRL